MYVHFLIVISLNDLLSIQEDVSEDIWNYIKEVLDQSADISDTVSLIELVISFVSFGEQRPQQTIKSYMHEVLKYPSSKPLINPVVST